MFSYKTRWKVWGGGVVALLLLSISGTGFADGPAVSGFIDTSYIYNFNKPITGTTALRSYDAQDNNIMLNTAHLAFQGTAGEVGYVIETDYGSDAALNTSAGSGAADDFDVQEAYLTYTSASKLGLKVGKFVTYEGIEVIESKDDPTISRGYLFGLAEPFTHVGGVVTYAMGKFDVAAGVVNGWDQTADINQGKTVVGKIGANFGDPLMLTLSGYHGPEQAALNGPNRDSLDLTGVTKIIPKVALWFQVNGGQEDRIVDTNGDGTLELATWGGAGLQPVVTITDKFTVGGRLEYFADDKGARTGVQNLAATNVTLAPAYKLAENLTVRAEYRYDTANKKIWTDDKGVAKDSNNTGSLEFIVAF